MQVSDSTLIAISACIALLGLCILFASVLLLGNSTISYEQFQTIPEDTTVVLTGMITQSTVHKNTTRLTLSSYCEIPAVLFEPTEEFKNKSVKLIGKKDSYKGVKQISITSIEQI